MSQRGQQHVKKVAAFAAQYLMCVWPFSEIMHERVKDLCNENLKKKNATFNWIQNIENLQNFLFKTSKLLLGVIIQEVTGGESNF